MIVDNLRMIQDDIIHLEDVLQKNYWEDHAKLADTAFSDVREQLSRASALGKMADANLKLREARAALGEAMSLIRRY